MMLISNAKSLKYFIPRMNFQKSNHRQVFEVKTSLGYKMVDSNHIVFLEAKGKFTIIHFKDHSNIITFQMLIWYSKYLFEPCFFRSHNSYIVNCSYINYYTNKEIIMMQGPKVPLSRRRSSSFKENLKYFFLIQTKTF